MLGLPGRRVPRPPRARSGQRSGSALTNRSISAAACFPSPWPARDSTSSAGASRAGTGTDRQARVQQRGPAPQPGQEVVVSDRVRAQGQSLAGSDVQARGHGAGDVGPPAGVLVQGRHGPQRLRGIVTDGREQTQARRGLGEEVDVRARLAGETGVGIGPVAVSRVSGSRHRGPPAVGEVFSALSGQPAQEHQVQRRPPAVVVGQGRDLRLLGGEGLQCAPVDVAWAGVCVRQFQDFPDLGVGIGGERPENRLQPVAVRLCGR